MTAILIHLGLANTTIGKKIVITCEPREAPIVEKFFWLAQIDMLTIKHQNLIGKSSLGIFFLTVSKIQSIKNVFTDIFVSSFDASSDEI